MRAMWRRARKKEKQPSAALIFSRRCRQKAGWQPSPYYTQYPPKVSAFPRLRKRFFPAATPPSIATCRAQKHLQHPATDTHTSTLNTRYKSLRIKTRQNPSNPVSSLSTDDSGSEVSRRLLDGGKREGQRSPEIHFPLLLIATVKKPGGIIAPSSPPKWGCAQHASLMSAHCCSFAPQTHCR